MIFYLVNFDGVLVKSNTRTLAGGHLVYNLQKCIYVCGKKTKNRK